MKIILASFLLFVGLSLNSCSDNNPTEIPSNQGVREIYLLNLQDNSSQFIVKAVDRISSFGFFDNSSIYFTNTYSYGNPSSGYAYAEKVNRFYVDSRSSSVLYSAPSYINFLNNVGVWSFLLETNGDIFRIDSDGAVVTNLSSSIIHETAGILDNISNDLFVGTKDFEDSQLYKQNLLTNQKTVLIDNNLNFLFPLFLSQDKSKIVYFEQNCVADINRGYIKVIDIQNPSNRVTLAECSITALLNSEMSDNNKLVFSSDGRIYLIDISASDLKLIASGNSVDISKDGSKIVYSTHEKNIYLRSLLSNENNLLITGNLTYAYSPRFSPDGQKIIFISSDFNINE